jgi:uncharacterized membrane protein
MNLRFYVICTAILVVLEVPVLSALGVPFLTNEKITATIHGATYSSDTLEFLNDTLINIDSNPPQSIVAKNGMYSFELAPGDYTITARCYRNNTLTYLKETTLKIEGEGNYVFDLLLYPITEYPAKGTIVDKMSDPISAESIRLSSTHSSAISYLSVALTLFLLLFGGYKLSRRHKKMEKDRTELRNSEKVVSTTETLIGPAENFGIETIVLKKPPLSKDLSEIMDVIRGHRGRITQKDLRGRLEYSEVKVSLLLSELEKRGFIRKFKNGRENIVVLIEEKS